MKHLIPLLLCLTLCSCPSLGIGGEGVQVQPADHAALDKFIDYAVVEQGRAKLHAFMDEETALALALRYWKIAVIASGDPDFIFMPKPEPVVTE